MRRYRFPPAMRRIWCGIALLPLLASPALAQDANVYEDSSLSVVPADAAFYSASLRMEEQWNILKKSNAGKKIMQNALVQMGLGQAQMMWNSGGDANIQMMKDMLADPQNQKLIALLQEAISKEFFLYADDGVAAQLALLNQLNMSMNSIQIEAAQSDNPEEVMASRVIELLLDNADTLQVPDMVMGFKVSDGEGVASQLDRLEEILTQVYRSDAPMLSDRFKRESLDGGDFLTLRLDGSLIPWEEIPLDDFPGDREQLNTLVDKVKEMTLVVMLGYRDGYLMFSVGDTSEHIEQFGKGETLADRAETQKMRQHLAKPIVSIGYVSESFMKNINNVQGQLESVKSMIDSLVEMAGFPDELKEKIAAEGATILDDFSGIVPEAGSQFGYQMLVEDGFEGYSFSWGNAVFDDSAPLTLTGQLGGNPILGIVSRGKQAPESYSNFADTFERVGKLVDEVVEFQLNDDEQAQYERVRDQLLPLLDKLVATTKENLQPALASNETAFVFDGKVKSAQLQNTMPLATNLLPIPELGIAMKVTDADKLRKGVGDYFDVAKGVLETFKVLEPNELGELKIPSPLVTDEQWGKIYQFALPPELGIDDQLAPNAGLSKHLAVVSLAPQTTARLMLEQPLQSEGYRVDVKRPAGAIAYFNFPGLVDLIEPWVNYGVELGIDDAFTSGMVKAQVSDWTAILRCFRGGMSVTYVDDDDVQVTHSHVLFQDL